LIPGGTALSLPLKKEDRRPAYRDYLAWPEEERWESINGVLYDMTPAPSTAHQRILGALFTEFSIHLRGHKCEAFMAPFDVRLPSNEKDDADIITWVQPDIVIVCDPSKIDERGCKGAPDLIVEILSPATARKDMKEKLILYETVGVNEYWIIQPTDKTIMVFTLTDSHYGKPEVYASGDELKVSILGNLPINTGLIFSER